jgi:hypothetical protein
MRKSLFLTLIVLICLNLVYLGVSTVNKATAIVEADSLDNLAMLESDLTPTELRHLEEAYQEMETEFRRFKLEDGEIPQTWAEISLERELDDILIDNPAHIVSLSHKRQYIVIYIHGWMTDGSDISCQLAADIFHQITSLDLTLKVIGEFVPSVINPMNKTWTEYLSTHRDDPRFDT